MNKITIVTGNPGKVAELQAIVLGKLDFVMQDLDIDEIQSLDLEKIVKDKAFRAYSMLKAPVIVDDVSAGLASLNGLPGPFIKFFNKQLGPEALYKLANYSKDNVTVTCMAAYYDGKKFIIGTGVISGTIVAPRGINGFGFDSVIVPNGQVQTMAEMSEDQKNTISHRALAFKSLLSQLEDK
jgi:non-canonical purine NTP pyrophosphatase (RdgB/HAM1 family)